MDHSMEQFWKCRMFVDELANAPHMDRMMKIMGDMLHSQGQVWHPSITGYTAGSSDYFRSQDQLQQLQPLDVKSSFSDQGWGMRRCTKREGASSSSHPSRVTSTCPPRPQSYQDAVDHHCRIDQDLESFRTRA